MCCYSCSSKWMCWCGFHVTTGSIVVAWIYLLAGFFDFLCAINLFFYRISIVHFINLISSILLMCGSVPIIVGAVRRKRTSKMYRPFLVITAISLVLTEIVGIIRFTRNGNHATIFSYFWPYILVPIVSIWLYSIVYRAYKFEQQNEEEKNGESYGQNAKVINEQYAKVMPMPI
ncbi:hypothetical protein niasHT_022979 [Heterodera trifolii]|uniref:Uncharacterized protein n=1 Tax=Heterodera trifolii TaxID=157864 RepID=A0ABD2KP47_9BILA